MSPARSAMFNVDSSRSVSANTGHARTAPDIMLGLRFGLSVGFLLGAITIAILGVASNYLLVALEKRMFRWRASAN
jgi:hypothetical protein